MTRTTAMVYSMMMILSCHELDVQINQLPTPYALSQQQV
jgi:hypothetical protein